MGKIYQGILGFQFQYGSIGRYLRFGMWCSQYAVSIPVWFDWESSGIQLLNNNGSCFNSSMVRLGVSIN